MISCSGSGQRFLCSSAEPALYFVQGAKVQKRELPAPARFVWVHTFAPSGIVLVDEKMNLFLALGLTQGKQEPMADERIELGWFAKDQLGAMVRRGEIQDGKTLVGYFMWLQYLADPDWKR